MPVLYDGSKNKESVSTVQKQCFYGAFQMPFKQTVLNVEFDLHNDTLPSHYYEKERFNRIGESNIINILLMVSHIQSGASLFDHDAATEE